MTDQHRPDTPAPHGTQADGVEAAGTAGSGIVDGTHADEVVTAMDLEGGPDGAAEARRAEGSIARSSALMASGTMVSRVLGLVRGMVLGAVVGGALTGDAFDVANSLPNQFYLLLAGGVLNAVLVPQITKAATHDDGGHEFVNRLLTISMAIMAAATVVATASAPLLVRLFSTPKWHEDTFALSTAFAFICLPQIFFYGLYTLFGQVLNARGHFAAYMWAPVMNNVVAIAGMVLGWWVLGYPKQAFSGEWTVSMIWMIAGTATLGVLAQALVLLIPLYRSGFRYRPVWGLRGAGLGGASRVAMWTFAAVAVSQLGFIVTSQVMTWANDSLTRAHLEGAGKLAYSNAFLFFMLPHSLITVSLVTALFTHMSNAVHAGRTQDVVRDLGRGLRMPAVLLVPATVGGVLVARPVMDILFHRIMGWSPTQATALAWVFIAMIVGLVPFGWLYLIQRVYYAHEDAKTPFYLQIVVTVIATLVNLSAYAVAPRHAGLIVGLGQTLSNTAAALVGFYLLRRLLGPLRLSHAVRTYVRLSIASAVAGLVMWGLLELLRGVVDTGILGGVAVLGAGGVLFLGVFLAIAHVMHVREVREVLDPILRRVGRA
ncbi:MAG: murein biosynthesis integral membrane protein MurJ [Micrococcales bacterium]|nr:murein biosynthesis integral membrane protein MurJ [Micrococcales bacterium]